MTALLKDSSPPSPRYAVVVSRFNTDVTQALQDGALQTFQEAGLSSDAVVVFSVPGAFELPLLCDRLAQSNNYAAILALGCVIRGETPHFDFVAGECARGIEETARKYGLPVVFGVLTTDTLAQAQHRANRQILSGSDVLEEGRTEKTTPASNKGAEAASTAMEMVAILQELA